MPKILIVMAIMMATASILGSGEVVVPQAPSSIRHVFLEAHPSATQPIYRFSTDDAGPLFQIEFEESGTHQSAEFRYTDRNWLMDAGEWRLSEETAEDSLAARETTLMALESGTHKR